MRQIQSKSFSIGTRSSRSIVDMLFSITIYGLLVTSCTMIYREYIQRAKVTEAIHLSFSVRQHYLEERHKTGKWKRPSEIDLATLNIDKDKGTIKDIQFNNASFVFSLELADGKTYKLGFRASKGLRDHWLCGYQDPLPNHEVIDQNQTDLPIEYLPIACQGNQI
jgi:hypothetical protein